MKEFKRMQEEANLKLMKDEEEKQRLQEEMEKQREEQQLLEKEQREKKKLKEKERIKRKKEEGSYLTKEQREKLERARIQLEAAGVQVPVRHPTQAATSASTEPAAQTVKKRVLYDDRRKKNQTNTKGMMPCRANALHRRSVFRRESYRRDGLALQIKCEIERFSEQTIC